jgi:hypothetical protein
MTTKCNHEHTVDTRTAGFTGMSITEQVEDDGIPVDVVVESIRAAGGAEIETSDDEPDDMNSDNGALWVVSNHRLLVAGKKVAEWTRCSVGSYGASGTRADNWDVSEDTNGGDQLPERLSEILTELGLDDECPDVPEPDDPEDEIETDVGGEWCVYWETVGDDDHVVERYASEADAEKVCAAKDRALRGANPGNLLCGYSVRQLVDGEWVHLEER